MLLCVAMSAQDDRKGYVTGSLETNNHYYVDDKTVGTSVAGDRFGSNNYLKLDYYKGRFSAGIQMEGYLPAIVGFNEDAGPVLLHGIDLSNIYASWTDDSFSVTAGTFYDQFGSGLLFRSWEDRALGINNAVTGARVTYSYGDILTLKALWGMPRFGTGLFTTNPSASLTVTNSVTTVRGADLSFALSNLLGWNRLYLSLEGSVLNRYEPISEDLEYEGGKPSSFGYSARINFESAGFFARAEYVDAGWKYFGNPAFDWKDEDSRKYTGKKGNACLVEAGYNGRGLGVTFTGRRIEYMGSYILSSGVCRTANTLNYIPALCTQYTYMLTNLHPYSANVPSAVASAFNDSGEMGGQLDAFYNFRRGTALGGKRGMKIHANFSAWYNLQQEYGWVPGKLRFRDFSIDVEKQWTRKFKMFLLYSNQKHYEAGLQNIFVADLLYKFTDMFSTRLELQYLSTQDYMKDWMAALVEVNFAPSWSIYASDMLNHGDTGIHYYNFGVSYAKSRTRVAVGYGRFKEGKICSGGVCRYTPAYTGASLTVTTSF